MTARVVRDMPPTRPSDVCIAFQDDSVFADFDRDAEGRLRLVRISYDGYGCNEPRLRVASMSEVESAAVGRAVECDDVGPVLPVLLGYLRRHGAALWPDALAMHGLLGPGAP